jgi:short subunit dehydrogenase-like uncharacterized protein
LPTNTPARTFDLIVFGASGFTGRLVAEYLLQKYGVGGEVSWAVAGRDLAKLDRVMDAIGAPAVLPRIAANAAETASLAAIAAQTKVVITTVGPYQRYGEPLVAACAAAGTDYVDLCGEPGWMAAMIARYSDQAKASGARIVFSCGFDSIPFDLGVLFLQHHARAQTGAPAAKVHGRVRGMAGGFSGGTIASLLATVEATAKDPGLTKVLADPFALTPGFAGPPQPSGETPILDATLNSWAAPFVMATINTKNVHRTNALLGHAYGEAFTYDEMMLTGPGAAGEKRAKAAAGQSRMQAALMGFAPTRAVLRRFALPKPGEGPTKAQREAGSFDVLFVGEIVGGKTVRASVKGDKDPGYGSTCGMIAESALCLAKDVGANRTPGGVWTPGAAMGEALITRLQATAGLVFAMEA